MRPNIAVLRSAIGPMLTETGTVQHMTGRYVQDEATGLEAPEYVTVYTGPVLVRPQADSLRIASSGGASFPVLKFEVTLPADSDVAIGDVLTVTDAPFDDDLTGRPLRLVDVALDAWQAARFCLAERRS